MYGSDGDLFCQCGVKMVDISTVGKDTQQKTLGNKANLYLRHSLRLNAEVVARA